MPTHENLFIISVCCLFIRPSLRSSSKAAPCHCRQARAQFTAAVPQRTTALLLITVSWQSLARHRDARQAALAIQRDRPQTSAFKTPCAAHVMITQGTSHHSVLPGSSTGAAWLLYHTPPQACGACGCSQSTPPLHWPALAQWPGKALHQHPQSRFHSAPTLQARQAMQGTMASSKAPQWH